MKLLSRLLSSLSATPQQTKSAQMFESLEGRQMLNGAQVIGVVADNRGETQITLNAAIPAASVNKLSVLVFTAGQDGQINTTDDVHVGAVVRWEPSGNRIIIRGQTAADAVFRVRLVASRLRLSNGSALDGEFSGTFPSGNGIAGGNFNCIAKPDTGANPLARFSTSSGIIDVKLFRGATATNTATPNTVASFLGQVNHGDYDNNIVHRVAKDFVVQWGGLNVSSKGQIGQVRNNPNPPTSEAGNSNVRGTLSYALGNHIADNEFFFNVVNNNGTGATPNLDDASNGGPFTAFAKVANSRSLATLDAMNGLHRVDLSQALSGAGSSVDNVPVNANVPVTGETAFTGGTTTKQLNPLTDLVFVRRVAVIMKISKLA